MRTLCLEITESALSEAVETLSRGAVAALPTETVYGLAADATCDDAVRQIYNAKGRPADNPLIVHVGSACQSVAALIERGYVHREQCSAACRASADRLIRAFWPGPLTLVLPRGERIAPLATAAGPTVGLRMPRHPVFQALLDRLDFPLAAPSANRSNRISPTSAAAVLQELKGRIPLVLDGGPSPVGVESSVVLVEQDGSARLLRPGGVPAEEIQRVLGDQKLSGAAAGHRGCSPGQGSVHYAPTRPLILADAAQSWRTQWSGPTPQRIAFLLFDEDLPPAFWVDGLTESAVTIHRLAGDTDGKAAAGSLYGTLREMDQSDADLLIVQRPQHSDGLWPAILDRLTRAAARGAAQG